MQDMEIQYGAQLTVRESQMAAFVNEGQVADVFGPGRFKLTTQTIPLLTNLRNWDKLFQSPFKSDVYFFSTRLKVDQKWGTPNAITIRDKEFGAVRLRAFGIYSYRIVDAKAFHVNVSGTRERYGVDELSGQLRSTIVGAITDLFAESQVPFLDMAANQDEFANQLRARAGGRFGDRPGAAASWSKPLLPEGCRRSSTSASAGMVGDMRRYPVQVANNLGRRANRQARRHRRRLATGVAMSRQ
jgi:membrane protease subunit (stomatin/prohibitin family)